MTKVAEKSAPPLNNNLKNWKSFRGNKALAKGELPKQGAELPKADITNISTYDNSYYIWHN